MKTEIVNNIAGITSSHISGLPKQAILSLQLNEQYYAFYYDFPRFLDFSIQKFNLDNCGSTYFHT